MPKSNKYTPEQEAFIRDGYQRWGIAQLTREFNVRFNQSRSREAIKSFLGNRNIVCGRKPGDLKAAPKVMTPAQAAWLKREYNNISIDEVTERFNQQFGLNLKRAQIRAFVKNHGFKSGLTGQFEKGQKSWNSGTKGLTGPNPGSFKKGGVPVNVKPLFHERICSKDGIIQIKVPIENPYTGTPTRYMAKSVYLWEQANGPVPEKHLIAFIDGDKLNCVLENLECISMAENVRRNQMRLSSQPEELREPVKALAKLITRTHELEKNMEGDSQ